MNCEIIAEFCQNHNGSQETLKQMIHEAVNNGADFAKIQSLRSSDLVFRERFEAGEFNSDGSTRTIKRPFKAEQERLKKLDLSDAQEAWFVDECKRAGIKSMITVFTRYSADRIAAAGFDSVKIASYDCKSTSLLVEVAERFDQILVSTGATYDHEVENAEKIFKPGQASFLHCVTIYPTPLEQLHLNRMLWLKRFSKTVGFSDHTSPQNSGLKASKLAIHLGASYLERHFTVLSRDETRDGPVSISPIELRKLKEFTQIEPENQKSQLVDEWPDWQVGLGQANRELSDTEKLNRDYYSGRVAAWVGDLQVQND
ncbi:MAG: N-acetylneuraminate synthase family protein [Actinomycetota bacterium]